MTNLLYRRGRARTTIQNADQVEVRALVDGAAVVDIGMYDDQIAGALEDFEMTDTNGMEQWHAADTTLDSASGSIREEIERRRRMLDSAYPFELVGNTLKYNPSQTGTYEFCLAISSATDLSRGDYVYLPRNFERLCAIIAKRFLSSNSSALHVGHPRELAVGQTFKTAMLKLNEQSGEWAWHPRSGYPDDPSIVDVKDEGMDFVAWRENSDMRPGKLFLVGQCACGQNWLTKLHDLTEGNLSKWFEIMTHVPFVRSIALPHHVSDADYHEAMNEAGLVFDRVRLCQIAEENVGCLDLANLKQAMTELVDLVVRATPVPVRSPARCPVDTTLVQGAGSPAIT